MSKSKLDLLKEVYNPAPSTQTNTDQSSAFSNYYRFYDMKPGERVIVRFVPDKNTNNPKQFLVEKITHNLEINGKRRSIPCLSMYGEECPICKVSSEYYKVKDKINGKKYWKSSQHIAQVIVVEDPLPPNPETGKNRVGELMYMTVGYQVYSVIKEAFGSDELEYEPHNFENGYDFIIKKTQNGNGDATYSIGTKFANKPRALTEAELSTVYEKSVDLATLLPRNPGLSTVQSMLDAEMSGTRYESEGSYRSDSSSNNSAPSVPSAASKPTPSNYSNDDEEEDQDVEAMLAEINARRAARRG